MKRIEIDARGLSCPQPVLRTKQAMMGEGVEAVLVLIDDETSKENITRFVESRGWRIKEATREGTDIILEITR